MKNGAHILGENAMHRCVIVKIGDGGIRISSQSDSGRADIYLSQTQAKNLKELLE